MKILSKRTCSPSLFQKIFFSLLCRRPTLPPPIQAHIDHLCQQIDELSLQLAEERLNHKQTRLKVFDFLLFLLIKLKTKLHLG